MPLFKRPHGQLVWDDVKKLLDQEAPENELLDYKRNCPSRIEPTIAAMANTYGGDIVIGVDEKADGTPEAAAAVRGVANAANLKQSIEQKNFNIQPPILGLFVEVVPIPESEHPDGRDDSAVLVIRIPQSDLLPHFVVGQGHFGRAGSHGRPYRDEHLTTARIEWLADRRQRHVEFRDDLLAWIDELHYSVAWHKVWCVPQFPSPSTALWEGDQNKLWDAIPRVWVRTVPCPFFWPQFPVNPVCRSVQHGVLWRAELEKSGVPIDHISRPGSIWLFPSQTCLVDDRGLVAMKGIAYHEVTSLARETEGGRVESRGVMIDWTIIATHLTGVCRYAAALYNRHGYNGPVQFGIEVGLADDVRRTDLFLGMSPPPSRLGDAKSIQWDEGPPHGRGRELSDDPLTTRARRLSETHECLVGDLLDRARQALLTSSWTRGFNHRMSAEKSEGYVERIEAAFVPAQP